MDKGSIGGGCSEVTRCWWCQVYSHTEVVCWKRAARCGKCGGQAHPGVSSANWNEGWYCGSQNHTVCVNS